MFRTHALPIVFLFAAVTACSSDTRKADDTLAITADTPSLTVPPVPATTGSGGMLDPNSASAAELARLELYIATP